MKWNTANKYEAAKWEIPRYLHEGEKKIDEGTSKETKSIILISKKTEAPIKEKGAEENEKLREKREGRSRSEGSEINISRNEAEKFEIYALAEIFFCENREELIEKMSMRKWYILAEMRENSIIYF